MPTQTAIGREAYSWFLHQVALPRRHDSLWANGNVPIALQRWEAVGLRDEIDTLDTMSDRLPL